MLLNNSPTQSPSRASLAVQNMSGNEIFLKNQKDLIIGIPSCKIIFLEICNDLVRAFQ